MKIISKNDQDFKVFIEKLNIAYRERESFGVKFSPLTAEEVYDTDSICALFDDGEMVAGACFGKNKNGQVGIRHLWSDINKKRKGYATTLLNKIFDRLKGEGEKEVYLSVIGTYLPAVNLYKKLGFRKVSYFANSEGQPCSIRMVKNLAKTGNLAFNLKCLLRDIRARIKYSLFYDKNSKPRFLNKILYKNK